MLKKNLGLFDKKTVEINLLLFLIETKHIIQQIAEDYGTIFSLFFSGLLFLAYFSVT